MNCGDDGNYLDSIAEDKKMVLVSFDAQGFNMPFRFHLLRDSLTDIIKLHNPNCLIPEYQGAEDFVVNINNKNELIPCNIIMPIQKSHKKVIMDNINNGTSNPNLWEHLHFLVNGKFPKHLTETIKKTKKQTFTSRLPIYYTNLQTGKRYVKNNNQFIEVDDDYVR